MADTKSTTTYLVQHTPAGYRVTTFDGATHTPVNDKTYFHVTSAYAALGRLQQRANVSSLNIKTDPAKAPVKTKKEAQK